MTWTTITLNFVQYNRMKAMIQLQLICYVQIMDPWFKQSIVLNGRRYSIACLFDSFVPRRAGHAFLMPLPDLTRLLTPRSRTAPPCYYVFVLVAKYLDKIFPDPDRPEDSHFKLRYTRQWTDRTGTRTVGNKFGRVPFNP